MKKTLSSLLCAAVSLLMLACGDGARPPELPLPVEDSGVPWADCDAGTDCDGGVDAGGDAGGGVDAGGGGTDAGTGTGYTDIRIMAANLTSGNLQSYDPGHGIRLMQGVEPDIVLIQEFNYGNKSPEAIQDMVDTAFPGFHHSREPGPGSIPNGVISRWPILASGEWDDDQVADRDFAWARIDIPGPRDLWAISVHLLTASASVRNSEAADLVTLINANVPAGDYLAIGGDFNTDSRSEACLTTFKSVVVTSSPYPMDHQGNGNTNASRGKPYDHVLVDADLKQYQTATVLGDSSFPAGLVLDSRVYSPLSEIAPVLPGDSGASQMQHMGVVKDFRVPDF